MKIRNLISNIKKAIHTFKSYIIAYRNDIIHNDTLKNNSCELLFLSNSINRKALYKNKWYDVICDPFVDLIEEKNLQSFILEPAARDKYIYPRYRKTLYIQPYLEIVRLQAQFNSVYEIKRKSSIYRQFDTYLNLIGDRTIFNNTKIMVKKYFLMQKYKTYFLKIFKKLNPKMGFNVNFYGLLGMGFNLACHEYGIPSVDIQHGAQGEYHSAYSLWKKIPKSGYELLPNIFWCWSQDEYNKINRWSYKVKKKHYPLLGGNLFIKKWQDDNEFSIPHQALINNIIDKTKINILITHQGIELPQWFIDTICENKRKFL